MARFSRNDAVAWSQTHDKYHRIIRDFLIPYYYQTPQSNGEANPKLESYPAGKDFHRLWQMTPRQVVDELFENSAVKTLCFRRWRFLGVWQWIMKVGASKS